MSTILVFGHKNPDNDAIMSAVVLAQLLGACDPDNDYVARRLGPLPKESAELLAECGFEEPELLESIPAPAEGEQPQKVVLCDHNESAQSVEGLASAEIAGVVDHHRIGDVHTAAPVAYVAMPWGSTCSIVYRLFGVLGVEPTDAQAKCLLSAMMTDMVMLKSPTTTEADRGFVAELGTRLGIDPVEFGMRIFLSRPQLAPEQMVSTDIKEFEVGSQRILIGQYETVSKDAALSQLAEIRAAMEAYREQQGADGIVLCVTDIMEEGSQVLMSGDTAAAERGLGVEACEDGVWMPGVLSRKKQVAAPILAAAE